MGETPSPHEAEANKFSAEQIKKLESRAGSDIKATDRARKETTATGKTVSTMDVLMDRADNEDFLRTLDAENLEDARKRIKAS